MANWFYLRDGQSSGPIGSAALKQLATSGSLKPSDKVRREDMAEWYEAKQVKGLFAAGQSAESSSGAATATGTPEGAPHSDESSHDRTESTRPATARAPSPNSKSVENGSTEKASSAASEITNKAWAGMRWAATLASKQACSK